MLKHALYIGLMAFIFSGCDENRIEPELYGAIRGIVIDDATALPLAGVSVTTAPASEVVSTDASGQFFFKRVEAGSVSVRASLSGYVTDSETVTVIESDTASLTIRLKESTSPNQPPVAGAYISPANLAMDLHPDSVKLKWRRSTDPNPKDKLTYSVILFKPGNQPDTVASAIADTCLLLKGLNYNTTYAWQIMTQDTAKATVFGQVFQFKTRAQPQLPILFARYRNSNYDIWAASADGLTQLRLTDLPGNQWRPRRNPQRTRIAFLSDVGVQTNLYTMANDGSDVRLVSLFPVAGVNTLDLDYCWSPDGSRLLFMSNNKLYTVSPDGSNLTVIATAPVGSTYAEVDWSSTTNHILARATGPEIYQSQFIRYSNVGFQLAVEQKDEPGAEGGPAVSLLGNKFLYTRDTTGLNSPDGRQLESCMFIKDKGGNTQVNVSNTKPPGTNDLDARFSANGALLIFVNTDNTGTGVKNICTVNLQGLQRKVLIADGEMPDWE